ncbi:MAG: hypothetical protein GF393_02105 [Armatimonadia bacterium]|nr:hypothetical protein [Armatimonadia bacterium]
MEIEPLVLIISLVIGTIVGMGYFAGLWITVQVLPKAKRPVFTWAASALIRVTGATVVFIILLRWGEARAEGLETIAPVAAGLAGFLIARFGSVAIWGQTREPKIPVGRNRPDQPESEGEQSGEADQ